MAPSTSRLAVDLSTASVRVVEGSLGGSMRCGSAAVTDGASAGGKISDPAGVARLLKALLARIEVSQTRAMVAASDALGTFRVMRLPASTTAKDVDAAIARELSFDPQRTATRWREVQSAPDGRTIYAAAWDRDLLRNVVEAVREAGLEPTVVELRSATVARAVPSAACIVIDLSSEPAECLLVDRYLPQVWHSFAAPEPLAGDAAESLARVVRSMLRFYRRQPESEFGDQAPVFVSSEQLLPAQFLADLAGLVGQPVHALPSPPRVPADVRYSTYLACIGLLMRRSPA